MRNSIREELTAHVKDLIDERILTENNVEDWHFHAFNEDYYIIGYHKANQWLKKHNIDPFEAIGIVQDFERDHFGESISKLNNSETTVNLLVYFYGLEIIEELQSDYSEFLDGF